MDVNYFSGKAITFKIVVMASALAAFGNVHAITLGKGGTTYSGGVIYSSGNPVGSYCTGSPSAGKYGSESYSGNSGCDTAVPGTDSDGDTMTDTWETTYSLNKYDAVDRYADYDNDNCTNTCEFAKGGLPNNDDSDGDGIKDMDDPDFTGIGSDANGTYKGRKFGNNNTTD